MRTANKEKALLIVKLIDKEGKSMSQVARALGLKSKSTIHEVYQREKFGVRRKRKKKLSTGLLKKRLTVRGIGSKVKR